MTHHLLPQEGAYGCKTQGIAQESEEELNEWDEKKKQQTAESMVNMSGHADIVVVQLPRGATAMVWMDLATGNVATSHAGLQVTLRRGVRDWTGHLVFPQDGLIFLSAVYDHFFLSGYSVQWLRLSGLKRIQRTYRV